MDQPKQICCQKCGSNQITANKKGFSGKKAVGGALLTGGVGILAGTIGSNKIIITCLNCGNQFKPGGNYKPQGQPAIVWDEKLKKHVPNQNMGNNSSNDALTMGVIKFFVALFIFVIILYFILR